MKILILNLHSVKNAGDLVLNNTALRLIRREFPNAEITVSINDLDQADKLAGPLDIQPSLLYWLKFEFGRWNFKNAIWMFFSILRWGLLSNSTNKKPLKWEALLHAYRDADIVISCPGNFLYSSGTISFPFVISCLSLQLAHWNKKPLYFLPQTIGPVSSWYEKQILKHVLKRSRLIFVRDDISQQFVKDQLGIPYYLIKLVPDTAFAAEPQSRYAGSKLLAKYGADAEKERLIGITTIDWGGQSVIFRNQATYENGIVTTIRALVTQSDIKVVLFSQVFGPNMTSDDRNTASRIYSRLTDVSDRVIFISEELDAKMLKSAYGEMHLFIGSRLHSNIFALVQHLPVIAIQYQYKTLGVMTMIGLQNYVLKIEDVSSATLLPFVNKGLRDREKILDLVKARMPELKRDAASIIVDLKKNYESITDN